MRPATVISAVMIFAAPAVGFAQDKSYPDFGSIAKPPGPASGAVPAVPKNIPGTTNTEKGGSRPQGGETSYPDGISAGRPDEEAANREVWRKSMQRVPLPKNGCFNSSYPSMEWKEVPCSTKPPPLQQPAPGQGKGNPVPENFGGGGSADFAAEVSGLISSAEGQFTNVTPGATETGGGTNDSFSLQLNSRPFTASLCSGHAGCQGWVQFVFANNSPAPYCTCIYVQYWLVNWGTTACPSGWSASGPHCVTNSAATTVTGVPTSSLTGLTLTGQASGGKDTVILGTSGGNLNAMGQDSTLNLETAWNAAEFNVFGDGNYSQAAFSNGTTIVVKTSVNDGTTNGPTCLQQSFTGETNNLNFADTTGTSTPICCAYGGASPNVQFMETNAGHTGTCGMTHLLGDPHITTADGAHYDFQSAGEFVSLKDSNGDEIQTRQTPVSTTFIGTDAYDGLTTCVSLNSAVAARVNGHRVTYEPNLSGVPDPGGLELRIDGALTTLGPQERDLGNNARIFESATGGDLEIDFPDGKVLFVTREWWASQSKWYLNVDVTHLALTSMAAGSSLRGIAGPIAGSWLPALPNGASLGPMPGPLQERYVTLYRTFADAWRVTDRNSLFDYAPGTSTATFTMRDWPLQKSPCVVPDTKPVEPASEAVAEEACRRVWDKNIRSNCVYDVRATGNLGFAKTYLRSQRTLADATTTSLTDESDPSQPGEWVTFTAYVAPLSTTARSVPSGTVQFVVDGSDIGASVKVDAKGRAAWPTSQLKIGKHRVVASYAPDAGSVFLPSTSLEKIHVVKRCPCDSDHDHR